MSITTIALPPVGMTLLPPWPAFIVWGGKRVENRGEAVARRCGPWRGRVALGMSKHFERVIAAAEAESVRAEPWFRWWGPPRFELHQLYAWAGHLFAVAELLDVQPNGLAPADPWAVPGEYGFRLGRVWQIEPVPCTGARGIYRIGGCARCGHVGAIEGRDAPLECRRCKTETTQRNLRREPLRVRAMFGADGRPCDMAKDSRGGGAGGLRSSGDGHQGRLEGNGQ